MDMQVVGSNKNKITLSDSIFTCAFNEPLIHQVVTAFQAASRAGTQAQKTRSEVRGGGIKPWKQKGSGRARAGTIRSPIWRKGGVVFAAKPRSYKQKVNKKMYKGALRSIFSELIRAERLFVVEDFKTETHKTSDLVKQLSQLNLDGSLLIITNLVEENLYLASRNLYNVDVRDVVAIDPLCLVSSEKVLVTSEAIKQLEEYLQ